MNYFNQCKLLSGPFVATILVLGACKPMKPNYVVPVFDDKSKTYSSPDSKDPSLSKNVAYTGGGISANGSFFTALPATFQDLKLAVDIDSGRFRPELKPYNVEAPLWTDGAAKFRYIKLPDGAKLDFDKTAGTFIFPEGTLLIKHFAKENDGKGPMETRVLLKQKGKWEVGAYQWLPDGSSKRITKVIQSPPDEDFKNGYRYPSEGECVKCHTLGNDDALGFSPAQLASSLTRLSSAGIVPKDLMKKISSIPAHDDPSDTTISTQRRALAYLAVNCGGCHRPQGGSPLLLLDRDNVDLAKLRAQSAMVPGKLEASRIWVRFSALKNRMPPIATSVDPLGEELIKAWIMGE